MKDLVFICAPSTNLSETYEFDTIMDFMNTVENDADFFETILNCTDIDATFFENPLTQKHFNSIKDLYEHCVSITV